MQSVIFDKHQCYQITNITGRIMTDELYKIGLISDYFKYPERLSIFEIYVLEYQMKRLGEFEFNLGYFDKLEKCAGDTLNRGTYDEYNEFIEKWNTEQEFRDSMRDRFKENDLRNLPAAAIAAYKLIETSENNMNRNNRGR
ncbi:MAG: hypothetical protein E7159_00625 [Firmicutes bacterium]|jgi:hypothetical protein|nr:hypothetical protein [Bacillota bacterium]